MSPPAVSAPAARWRARRPGAHLQRIPNFPPIVGTVLAARGITTRAAADLFYKPHLQEDYDPLLLPGMAEAITRTRRAIRDGELVALFGDFDVDGVTSIAILQLGLRPVGAKTVNYIPDRFREGYGLNLTAVRELRARGCSLLITADCGISSVEEVALANQLGLDVIILDHHTVPDVMPAAVAAVNPKRLDSPYPFTELAAVGVAYRFLQVLYDACGRTLDSSSFIDLVALGTVVDVAPLADENRRIVEEGLGRMRGGLRPGLEALATVAQTRPQDFNAETLGFAIGPRMNAAGRLKHAYLALDLMLAEDPASAKPLAQELDLLNRQRQQQTQDALRLADEIVGPANDPLLMIGSPDIGAGIVGLVASRLVEKWNRPAIVFQRGHEESRASCRSIPAFDIVRAIRKEKDLLVRHGGHRAAAGFTVKNDLVNLLRDRLVNTAAETLDADDLRRVIDIDCETPLTALNGLEVKGLMRFEPCGHGNPKPVLLSRGVRLVRPRVVGGEGEHLSMTVKDGPLAWPAIAFRRGADEVPQEADVVYSLTREFGGDQLKLEVLDFAPTAERRPLEGSGG
jgi:single-stranded-DNA-specific exonuclease